MRRATYSRLQQLPISYFDQRPCGDLMTRVIDDVNAVERVLVDGIEQGTIAVLTVIGVLVILFARNGKLAFFALVPLPILLGGFLGYTALAVRRYRARRKAASELNSLLVENLQGIREIKAFGRQRQERQRFAERANILRRRSLDVWELWAVYSPATSFVASLGTVLVLWNGAPEVAAGDMTVGELVAFIFYLLLLYEPIGRLQGLNQLLQSARAASERVFDILDAAEELPGSPHVKKFEEPVRGEVCYENVSLSYEGDRAALRGISLHARPGETVALVGPTGAGKSSLVNLLPVFYRPSSGSISIDSRSIAELSLESIRAQISIVRQDVFLFSGTVRENIRYGKPNASEGEIIAASELARCHEFVARLPCGYDTLIGDAGVKLSAGEKQRIGIARALLKNSPILIFDEATSDIDPATERLILDAQRKLMSNRTSFIIAHRLGTIRAADQILVLSAGAIIERGRHDDLLNLRGVYADLWSAFVEQSKLSEWPLSGKNAGDTTCRSNRGTAPEGAVD
jgi:ABC-type multidrug transport system fused ATPase/permease subunit